MVLRVRRCVRWKAKKTCYTRKKPKRTRICKRICAKYREMR